MPPVLPVCSPPSSYPRLQGLPIISFSLDGTNATATLIDDLSTCDNRTAGELVLGC